MTIWEQDKLPELLDLAIRMREAQKRYFRTRTRTDLIAAKNLEVEFDQGVEVDRDDSSAKA